MEGPKRIDVNIYNYLGDGCLYKLDPCFTYTKDFWKLQMDLVELICFTVAKKKNGLPRRYYSEEQSSISQVPGSQLIMIRLYKIEQID